MENSIIIDDDIKFRHPFNMIISGGTGSGKTEWIAKLLKNYKHLISFPIEQIIYCYGIFDPIIFEFENNFGVKSHQGLPSEEYIKNLPKNSLIIFDDLMLEAKSAYLDSIFTRGSHHWKHSFIFVTQHIFSKDIKIARNNAHYIILLKNIPGHLQVRNLALQLYPTKNAFNAFMEAYKNATENNKWGYILIDLHPASTENLRLRTNIFPSESPIIIYLE